MIYLYLFVSFLQVGMFSFGGGYAAMPLIQEQVVTIHHWLDISEFTDSGFCSDGSAYPAFQTGAQCFTASESAVCFSKRIL